MTVVCCGESDVVRKKLFLTSHGFGNALRDWTTFLLTSEGTMLGASDGMELGALLGTKEGASEG